MSSEAHIITLPTTSNTNHNTKQTHDDIQSTFINHGANATYSPSPNSITDYQS